MAAGVFPKFVKFVARYWLARYPDVRRTPMALSSIFPATNTFEFGIIEQTSQPLFVNLQNSWKPGDSHNFTVNVLLSEDADVLRGFGGIRADFVRGKPGSYRLGTVVHERDKWWSLRPDFASFSFVWHASSYDDETTVFEEAIADVTGDLERMLELACFTRRPSRTTPSSPAGP